MRISSICRVFIIVILMNTAFVWAQDNALKTIKVELEFIPDLENGAYVFEICASCHLPDGWGNEDGTYPQLAGQHASVLMQQLLNIRSGKRENPIMYPFVQERTMGGYQNMADVVAYISTLPKSPSHGKGSWKQGSQEYLEGERLYRQRCVVCHGDVGQGNSELKVPRLQGQHYAYLVRETWALAKQKRTVSPGMLEVIRDLDLIKIEKITNYISNIPVFEDALQNDGVTQ